MSIAEILDAVQIITDGERQIVQLDYDVWEEILSLLEDLEDAEEIRQAKLEDDEVIPWEQVVAYRR